MREHRLGVLELLWLRRSRPCSCAEEPQALKGQHENTSLLEPWHCSEVQGFKVEMKAQSSRLPLLFSAGTLSSLYTQQKTIWDYFGLKLTNYVKCIQV